MNSQCVLLFVEYPEPGMVKTRLAADVGAEPAARLARAMAEDALAAMEALTATDLILCFAPKRCEREMRHWLGLERKYWPQEGGDEGKRRNHAVTSAFRRGYERVAIVNTDVPEMNSEAVAQALDSLRKYPACLGPARGGGYWLIGFAAREYSPGVFHGIPWRTAQEFDRTLHYLENRELVPFRASTYQEVNTLAGWRSLARSGGIRPGIRTRMETDRVLGAQAAQ